MFTIQAAQITCLYAGAFMLMGMGLGSIIVAIKTPKEKI